MSQLYICKCHVYNCALPTAIGVKLQSYKMEQVVVNNFKILIKILQFQISSHMLV